MRIYMYTPQVYLRPRNTDWLYNKLLARLPEFNPNLYIWLQRSTWSTTAENARLLASIARYRLHAPVPRSWMPKEESTFSLSDVRRARPDVIYGQSPSNVANVPVIFNCGPTHVEHMRSKGVSEADIQREMRIKSACASRATLIASHSRTNLQTLAAYMPQHVRKMRCLPFFLPHLTAISAEGMQRKFADPRRRELLFVGREARRKGLPAVLLAFERLRQRTPDLAASLRLRIVTNFADGPVAIPQIPGVELLGELPREQVHQLLEESHVLLMPSRFESYGWIYLEAMAAGCVPLACDQATQREILGDGRAGILVRVEEDAGTAENIEASLAPVLSEVARLRYMAEAALQFCRSEYFPEAISKQFETLGEEALGLRRDGVTS